MPCFSVWGFSGTASVGTGSVGEEDDTLSQSSKTRLSNAANHEHHKSSKRFAGRDLYSSVIEVDRRLQNGSTNGCYFLISMHRFLGEKSKQ